MIIFSKIILSLFLVNLVICCILNDATEGYCIQKSTIENEIYFCKDYVPDNVCIPYLHVLLIHLRIKNIINKLIQHSYIGFEKYFIGNMARLECAIN